MLLSSLAGLEDIAIAEVSDSSGMLLEAATLETDLGPLDAERMIGGRFFLEETRVLEEADGSDLEETEQSSGSWMTLIEVSWLTRMEMGGVVWRRLETKP